MPFKMKLPFKKTKRYEVSTKNSFMVGVHMLDNSFMQCMLSSDSTGKECLESIAQKIELNEAQYYGLRYVTKKLQFRWIDLDRPLKKQLDKFAHSPRLYFGVMYYVARAHRLLDSIARYQYFLQLKNDVIDGRLSCTADQIIQLAAYSLQAEFGDYDHEKHTAEVFLEYPVPLLPKTISQDQVSILEEVLVAHSKLRGVYPVQAEIQYIKEVQALDDYGMEYYVAKDTSNKELYLATSYAGVFARHVDGLPPIIFYMWSEISRVGHSKRSLELDTAVTNVRYLMEDPDTAKYLCRMCQLQQKFYKSSKASLNTSTSEESVDTAHDHIDPHEAPSIEIKRTVLPKTDVTDIPDVAEITNPKTSLITDPADTYFTKQDLSSIPNSTDYRPSSRQNTLTPSLPDVRNNTLTPSLPDVQPAFPTENVVENSLYVEPSHQQFSHLDPTPIADTYASRLAALPAYRPAPDYDSVMRQRLSQQHVIQQQQIDHHHQQQQQLDHQHQQQQQIDHHHQQQHQQQQIEYRPSPDSIQLTSLNIGNAQVYTHPDAAIAYSQPEIRAIQQFSDNGQSQYAKALQDAYRHYGSGDVPIAPPTNTNAIHPTNSSPDLHMQDVSQYNVSKMFSDLMYHYKPPPPYPRGSTSVPDLATQTTNSNISTSPDLVSRKNIGLSRFAEQSRFDKSVENLSEDFQNLLNTDHNVLMHSNSSSGSSLPQFYANDPEMPSVATFNPSVSESPPLTPKSQIEIQHIAANEAPPLTKSAIVATRRESFRRQMIVNSTNKDNNNQSSFRDSKRKLDPRQQSLPTITDTSFGDTSINSANCSKYDDSSICSANSSKYLESSIDDSDDGTEVDEDLVKDDEEDPAVKPKLPDKQEPLRKNWLYSSDTSSVCSDKGSGRAAKLRRKKQQNLANKHRSPPGHTLAGSGDSSRDAESDDSDTLSYKRLSMGPLKMAAMNGLSVSRPNIFGVINDETRAPTDDRRRELEHRLDEGQVFAEFDKLMRRDSAQTCTIGELAGNGHKNRFRDVLPYDHNRVKLTSRVDNSTGYINASHVKITTSGMDWWYISSQAPMENTMEDFWQMIWEYNVHVVAMLTDFVEQGKAKSFPYWPRETGEKNKIIMEDFEVVLNYRTDSHFYVTNIITLRYRRLPKERQIWHLQYTAWPDHGCPEDIFGFLGFIDEVDSVQRLAESESQSDSKKFPVVVHCSAGVGRSGVVILTEIMKACLEHNKPIDIPKALGVLRQQRMFMVQTVSQYSFVYETLIQYLKNTRLI